MYNLKVYVILQCLHQMWLSLLCMYIYISPYVFVTEFLGPKATALVAITQFQMHHLEF